MIEVRQLTTRYGDRLAVRDLDFAVADAFPAATPDVVGRYLPVHLADTMTSVVPTVLYAAAAPGAGLPLRRTRDA